MHKFCIFSFYFCSFLHLISSFNLDTTFKRSILRSPLFYAFEGDAYPPTFFGYSINKENNSRLIVGAPKTVNAEKIYEQQSSSFYPQARGDVLKCTLNLSSSPLDNACQSTAQPPGSAIGNSFGLSMTTTPNRDIIACSPTKIQFCRPVRHNPGYCYKEFRGTKTWQPDPKTRNESCQLPFLDLIFLLDASGSIGKDDFTIVKNWVKDIANNFRINDDTTRIGVIRYSHFNPDRELNKQFYINTEIPLGSIQDRQEFNERVDQIEVTDFQTFTAHALNKSVMDFMKSDGFYQANTAKVLVLLTDGRSNDHEYLASSARYVRSLGIITFAVGVGEADIDELRTVANGGTSDRRVFNVTNFSLLSGIAGRLGSEIRSVALEGSFSNNTNTDINLEFAEYGFSVQSSGNLVSLVNRRRVEIFLTFVLFLFVLLNF